MDSLGLTHTALGFGAILSGGVVVFARKGTRRHRFMGRVYVASMVGLNATALMIYELFGGFGIFHWGALLSLATVVAGFVPAFWKRPRGAWISRHAQFMSWSYVALLMAAASELTTRLRAGLPFGPTVAVTSLVVLVLGAVVIRSRLPSALRSLSRPRAPVA